MPAFSGDTIIPHSEFRIPNSEFEILRFPEHHSGIRTACAPCRRQYILVTGNVHVGSLAADVSLSGASKLTREELRSVSRLLCARSSPCLADGLPYRENRDISAEYLLVGGKLQLVDGLVTVREAAYRVDV